MGAYADSVDHGGDWFDQNTPAASGRGDRYTATASILKTALGRDPNAGEVESWANGPLDIAGIQQAIYASDEAKAYGAQQTAKGDEAAKTGTPSGGGSDADRVRALLTKYGVDPQEEPYWQDLVKQHGGVEAIGPDWLEDRIKRADSSEGVRNGTVQKFQDGGGNAPPDYLAPFTEQFSYDKFASPTEANDQNDPGFTTRLKAGQDAIERSAAARGSLLTGSTVKAQTDYAQDYASNEYEKTYGRDLNTYQTNYGKALGEYNNRKATFYSNQDNPFSKLLAQETLDSGNQNYLSGLGLDYARLSAGTLSGGSKTATDYLTQGGNAAAAGQVGAGNAYGGALSGIGNNALMAYYLSQYGKSGRAA